MTYNGHKNWTHWNVSLWINNDEGLYRQAVHFVNHSRSKDYAANRLLQWLREADITETPDGAKYSKTAIRAALVGL